MSRSSRDSLCRLLEASPACQGSGGRLCECGEEPAIYCEQCDYGGSPSGGVFCCACDAAAHARFLESVHVRRLQLAGKAQRILHECDHVVQDGAGSHTIVFGRKSCGLPVVKISFLG